MELKPYNLLYLFHRAVVKIPQDLSISHTLLFISILRVVKNTHLQALLPRDSSSVGLGQGLRICILKYFLVTFMIQPI